MQKHVLSPARLVVLAVALAIPFAGAKEPENLYRLKQEIRTYLDTGEYDRDVAAVATEAKAWLEARLGKPIDSAQGKPTDSAQGKPVDSAKGKPFDPAQGKPAIVFDIDETLLSNLPHMKEMDFGYIPPNWNEWVAEGKAPAIKPVAELFLLARKLDVAIFIMSGRRESERQSTVQNLREAGLGDYTALYCKPNEMKATTESFKTGLRKKITEDGYTILLNIGDQQSDLNGGYAEKTFKLPNPFYITK